MSDELFDCKLKGFESGSGRREVDSAKRSAVPGRPNRGEEPESCLWASLEAAGTHVVFGARPLPFITNVPRVTVGDGPLDYHLQKRRRSQNLEPCRTDGTVLPLVTWSFEKFLQMHTITYSNTI